ncbi:MAG: phosphopantothenoylcysteine decarboxylase [bacterium]
MDGFRGRLEGKRKLRVLITAGPTREYIDPVRFISNDSSGMMGFALAAAARDMDCLVTLISGPVALKTPEGITRVDVVSAEQMYREVKKRAAKADVVIMAAAVADWRPRRMLKEKMKKGPIPPNIELVRTHDILMEIGKRRRPQQRIVGFALETKNLEENAREKLRRKGCSWVVANTQDAIGALASRAILFSRSGKRVRLPKLPKEDLAYVILSNVLS